MIRELLVQKEQPDLFSEAQTNSTRLLKKIYQEGYLTWDEVSNSLYAIEQAVNTAYIYINQKQYGTAVKIAILYYAMKKQRNF